MEINFKNIIAKKKLARRVMDTLGPTAQLTASLQKKVAAPCSCCDVLTASLEVEECLLTACCVNPTYRPNGILNKAADAARIGLEMDGLVASANPDLYKERIEEEMAYRGVSLFSLEDLDYQAQRARNQRAAT